MVASYGQMIRSAHQNTDLGSKVTAFHPSPSTPLTLASKSPVKHQHSGPEEQAVHNQPRNLSNAFTQQRLIHRSPLVSEKSVSVGAPGANGVIDFPATAISPPRASLPIVPSSLLARVAPYKDDQHQHLININIPLKSTNPHIFTKPSLSTPLSSFSDKYHTLSKTFHHPLLLGALEHILDTAHANSPPHSHRIRSASMSNLWSPHAIMNMNFSNNFGPGSMPTPPYEQPSSLTALPCSSLLSHYDYNAPPRQNPVVNSYDRVDMSFNADNSSLQNRQDELNLQNVQHPYRSNLSSSQNSSLTSSLHPGQVLTQLSDHQDVSDLSASSNGILAADQWHQSHRRLDVKPNYSYDEVKMLIFDGAKHAQKLRATITGLQSANNALQKEGETLQRERLDMLQQNRRYEHIIVQKDRQLEAMHIRHHSLKRQCKQFSDNNVLLIAALRKEKGTGNPSEIARSIRWNHASNPIAAASQGSQYSAKAFPMNCANGVQPSIPRQGSEQIFVGDQQPVQLVSTPSSSAVTVTDDPSWSLHQRGCAVANHNNAHPTVPASSQIDEAKASSPALSQPGSVHANHDGTNFRCDQFTNWVQSSQQLGATIEAMTTDGQNNNYAMGQELEERLTIDLTDDAQPPSSLASYDQSSHKTRQRTYCWLQGENPFRKGTKTQQQIALLDSRQPSQSNAEGYIALAESPVAGRVAPLPDTATDQKTKEKRPKKTKVVLTAEDKKERAKGYRKTAAEKKRRDNELAQQSLQCKPLSNDPMHGQKRDRRVARGEQRQKQTRQAMCGLKEPQMTLDGQSYQENIGVRQNVHRGSIERAEMYDHDSLFGDDEDDLLEMKDLEASSGIDSAMHEEDTALEEGRKTDYEAELETTLAADADAKTRAEIEQNGAPGDDDGYHDFSSNGEESEED